MKTKRIIGIILTLCMLLGMTSAFSVTASAEVVREVIYETTKYDDGEASGGDGTALVFFKGDLPGTNGEKYIITYEGKARTNQPGMNFRLYYDDKYVNAYQKDDYKEAYNGVSVNRGGVSPYNFKAVIEVDFSKEIPEAAVKVYDHDLTTVLVDKVEQLKGCTGLSKIGVKNWTTNGSNHEHYERPINPKLTIKKVEEAVEEITETIALNSVAVSGSEVAVDVEIVAVEEDIPYALIAAYYNGNNLVYADYESDVVTAGTSKVGHTFDIPSAVAGNYTNVYVYLWDGVDSIVPYTEPVSAN